MGILAWVVFGALAGWVASILVGNNARQGCLMNIVVGVIGAFIGGFLVKLITGRGFDFEFTIESFIVAVIGAVLLLVITGAGRRR